MEAPEIEKEVKRLLRLDYEAVSVKWEVITEEELNSNKGNEAGQPNPDVEPSASGDLTNNPQDLGLDLSDSDDERHGVDMDSDENSRMSANADDSRLLLILIIRTEQVCHKSIWSWPLQSEL